MFFMFYSDALWIIDYSFYIPLKFVLSNRSHSELLAIALNTFALFAATNTRKCPRYTIQCKRLIDLNRNQTRCARYIGNP